MSRSVSKEEGLPIWKETMRLVQGLPMQGLPMKGVTDEDLVKEGCSQLAQGYDRVPIRFRNVILGNSFLLVQVLHVP